MKSQPLVNPPLHSAERGSQANFQQNVQHWFNTSALAVVPFTYGNLGRNVLRQDGVQNFDFGLFKHIQLTESKELEFRTESFNLFNSPFFGPPVANFSSPLFGQDISAANPRFIQFGLKFIFSPSVPPSGGGQYGTFGRSGFGERQDGGSRL
jgi:hypothetical protein